MDEKANKSKMRRMNKEEFAYNKHLLREINDKRKTSNYDSQSRAADDQASQIWKEPKRLLDVWCNQFELVSQLDMEKIDLIH